MELIICIIISVCTIAALIASERQRYKAKASEASLKAKSEIDEHQLTQANRLIDEQKKNIAQQQSYNNALIKQTASLDSTNNALQQKVAELGNEILKVKALNDTLTAEITIRDKKIAHLEANLEHSNSMQEKLEKRQSELNEQSKEAFKNIATELLKQNSQELKTSNESRLSEILRPFNDNIKSFRDSIKDYYENGLKETSSLKTTISELTKLNNQLGKEANELTTALRGNINNTQGPWGENILTQILERSGLVEGINFKLQATQNFDGSKIDDSYRPDVLLALPGEKVLVIDSKVNITSYINYANATSEDDRKRYLSAHIKDVERQINNLSGKDYPSAVKNSANFVIMFMPNEAAYLAAIHGDSELWLKAYNKHILLVSPTHLISVVKLIEQLWKSDKQNKNAMKIAEESGRLVDKLIGIINDLEAVGTSIKNTQKNYDAAMNKLRDGKGNILSKARAIVELGANAKKTIPANDNPYIENKN